MKLSFKQRFTGFFFKERKEAIANILEKVGTALLIGVILGSIISDKGTFFEVFVITLTAFVFLFYSVYLRAEQEET